MASNDGKPGNYPTDPSADVLVKATKYPPGYTHSQSPKPCNTAEEKHRQCHPMHCHHIQPMQSTMTAALPEKSAEKDGSIKS